MLNEARRPGNCCMSLTTRCSLTLSTLSAGPMLLAELDHVRRTGVAVNDEELESALRSIAVPVRSRSGQVIAAVNIAIPWSPAAITDLVGQHAPALHDTARQIAARII